MRRFQATIAALAIGIVISSAGPAAAENVLRFTSGSGGAVTMDPHSRWIDAHRAAVMQVYESLLDIDSSLAIVPQLALDWKPLDPTNWEFELRPDVTFMTARRSRPRMSCSASSGRAPRRPQFERP
jgi:peptide/nickel transport system substrate-binding protein